MAIARLPAYVRPMKLAGDKTGYYFELPAWARPTKDRKTGKLTAAVRHGQACPVISTALSTDLAQVHAKGAALNDALRDWRTGKMGQRRIAEGSVAWLFQWYREQERFIKNKAKTRKDYKALTHQSNGCRDEHSSSCSDRRWRDCPVCRSFHVDLHDRVGGWLDDVCLAVPQGGTGSLISVALVETI